MKTVEQNPVQYSPRRQSSLSDVLCQCVIRSVRTAWWSCVHAALALRYQHWKLAASTCRVFVSCVWSLKSDLAYSSPCPSQSFSQLLACLRGSSVPALVVESPPVSVSRSVPCSFTAVVSAFIIIAGMCKKPNCPRPIRRPSSSIPRPRRLPLWDKTEALKGLETASRPRRNWDQLCTTKHCGRRTSLAEPQLGHTTHHTCHELPTHQDTSATTQLNLTLRTSTYIHTYIHTFILF